MAVQTPVTLTSYENNGRRAINLFHPSIPAECKVYLYTNNADDTFFVGSIAAKGFSRIGLKELGYDLLRNAFGQGFIDRASFREALTVSDR